MPTPALHPYRLVVVVDTCWDWKKGRTGGPVRARPRHDTANDRSSFQLSPTLSHRTPRLHGQDRRHPGLARRHLPADRVPAVDRAAPPAGRVSWSTVFSLYHHPFLAVVPPRSVFLSYVYSRLLPLRRRAFEKPGQAVQKFGGVCGKKKKRLAAFVPFLFFSTVVVALYFAPALPAHVPWPCPVRPSIVPPSFTNTRKRTLHSKKKRFYAHLPHHLSDERTFLYRERDTHNNKT